MSAERPAASRFRERPDFKEAFARLRQRRDDEDLSLVLDELVSTRVDREVLRKFVEETLTNDEAWRSQAREVLRRTHGADA